MRYDEYLANGWPIASGPVEGACKNLILGMCLTQVATMGWGRDRRPQASGMCAGGPASVHRTPPDGGWHPENPPRA